MLRCTKPVYIRTEHLKTKFKETIVYCKKDEVIEAKKTSIPRLIKSGYFEEIVEVVEDNKDSETNEIKDSQETG